MIFDSKLFCAKDIVFCRIIDIPSFDISVVVRFAWSPQEDIKITFETRIIREKFLNILEDIFKEKDKL